MKSYFDKFKDTPCNCETRNLGHQPCSLWWELSDEERRDSGIMWRIGYNGDYGIVASKQDYIEAKKIIKKMYRDHSQSTLDWWEKLQP